MDEALLRLMDELRIVAHALTVVEFAYLFLDDRARSRDRQWVWLAALAERVVVLVLLAVDVRDLAGSWLTNRWLLTPVTVLAAVVLGWYVWRRVQQRWEMMRDGPDGDSMDSPTRAVSQGH